MKKTVLRFLVNPEVVYQNRGVIGVAKTSFGRDFGLQTR